MVKIEDRYLNKKLTVFLSRINNAVVDKHDGLIFCGGREGFGKSTIGFQMAWYLDRNFNIDKIAFTGEEFIEKCMKGKPGDCIVFDESYSVFNNRNYATNMTKKIIDMLTRIRFKQLFYIIICPTFFDLNKYLVTHRAQCFVRVLDTNLKRGNFEYYMYDTKNTLYRQGKKDHNYNVVSADLVGSFTNWSPINMDEYDKRKLEGMDKSMNELESKSTNVESDKLKRMGNDELLVWLRSKNLLKFGAMGEIAEDFYHINARSLSRRLMSNSEE